MRTYTGSTNCDDRAKRGNNKGKIMVNLKENCRDPEEIARLNQQYIQNGKPPKYDINKADLNIYYETCKTTEEAFEMVFGDAMEQYNAGQKRNDRKTSIEKELAKLEKGKVQQELVHCMVVQVGNHDDHPPIDECVEILQEYRQKFVERFPNIRMISCSIHLDELDDGTPHLQMYYIPVKTKERHEAMQTGKKWSGMDVQPSLTGALEQMGYTNDATVMVPKKDEQGNPVLDDNGEPVMVEKHDYQKGAMAQWQRDFNGLLDEICLEHGIVIDHYMRGKQVTHQDTRDYYEGKIAKETARAMHSRDKAEADLSQAILAKENAQEEAEKLRKENQPLKVENEALKAQNDALKAENSELEKTVEATIKNYEDDFYKAADEHFAYYKRDRTKIEQDPAVYRAFEDARKLHRRTQNAWNRCRSSFLPSDRRRWARKAIKLQQQSNEAWQSAKNIAEASKMHREMLKEKAEIKKEVNDLLKPHIADFEKFCRTYEALSVEKQAQYRAQFELVRKKNKGDIKTMGQHLKTFLGLWNESMAYDKIKEVQQDRRAMNRMTNDMLRDIKQEAASAAGDVKSKDDDINDILQANKYDSNLGSRRGTRQAPRREEAADLESLLEDDGLEL